ncbi:MAG TPA: DUF418 domain-containing protein [Polyangiaceae bacterium]|nr:DUF418 domain-containing protein [Polyangiaceae bacterium]
MCATSRAAGNERVPLSPIAEDGRLANLDVLRAVALLGVLLVNLLTEFRVSIFEQWFRSSDGSPVDLAVNRFLEIAIEFKAFVLFSFLFGVGLAIQFDRCERAGRGFTGHVARRFGSLLVIGLVHLTLIWNGDILTEYALAGFLALPLLGLRRSLLFVAVVLLIVFVAPIPYPEPFPSAEVMRAHIRLANRIYANGSYAEVQAFRWRELPAILALLLAVLPRTLSLFALGIWAWRAQVFAPRGQLPVLRWTAWLGVLGGGLATLLGAGIFGEISLGAAGIIISNLAAIALALGYGSLLLLLYDRPRARRWLQLLAPLGRMALSNYLMQSVIFGWIFYGYGLGCFATMSSTHAVILGIAVYGCQAALSHIWLQRYTFGPVEWLWRSATYAAWQPLRRP